MATQKRSVGKEEEYVEYNDRKWHEIDRVTSNQNGSKFSILSPRRRGNGNYLCPAGVMEDDDLDFFGATYIASRNASRGRVAMPAAVPAAVQWVTRWISAGPDRG
jgi:hypothetical protein